MLCCSADRIVQIHSNKQEYSSSSFSNTTNMPNFGFIAVVRHFTPQTLFQTKIAKDLSKGHWGHHARPSEEVRPWPDQNFSHSIQNKSYIVKITINTFVSIKIIVPNAKSFRRPRRRPGRRPCHEIMKTFELP